MSVTRVIILCSLLLTGITAGAASGPYQIMVVTWRGCEDACQGFQDYIRERGIEAEFILRDAARRKDRIPGYLVEAKEKQVDLILSWGTSVTLGIAGRLSAPGKPSPDEQIPIVFTIVADPVGTGIVESLEKTGRPNVTGTYNRVPERVNIETIRTYLPDFKRLGLIYNTNENNSVLKRDEIERLSSQMGFELVARSLPLDASGEPRISEIATAMAELKASGVDFLYLGSSSFLRKNGDIVTKEAMKAGIPVLSPYENLVRESDALLSIAARYYEVGQLAGRQAERILVEGADAGSLAVARMTNFAVVINMSAARTLDLFPPMNLLQIAETVN